MVDRTEEEQLEAFKKWWEDNGKSLIIGIVIVLAGVFGFRSWETNNLESAEAASNLYEDMLQAVQVGTFDDISDENKSTAEFIANKLKQEYPKTIYAHFSAMELAKLDVEAGDLDAAEAELSWVLENGVEDNLGIIVNERLARVKFAKETYGEALKQLDTVKPGKYKTSYEELRGDIYYAMGEMDQAREAYQSAVASQDNPDARPFLKMKLQDLEAPLKNIAINSDEAAAKKGDASEG